MSRDDRANLARRQLSLEALTDRERVAHSAALVENLDLRAAVPDKQDFEFLIGNNKLGAIELRKEAHVRTARACLARSTRRFLEAMRRLACSPSPPWSGCRREEDKSARSAA